MWAQLDVSHFRAIRSSRQAGGPHDHHYPNFVTNMLPTQHHRRIASSTGTPLATRCASVTYATSQRGSRHQSRRHFVSP